MLHPLLKKIINSGVGKSRFIMAGIGLTVGILLILSAIQVQVNYNQLLYGSSNNDSTANFLVINKKIDGNNSNNTLTISELEKLQQQPFVDAIGKLSPSKFKVSAQGPGDNFPFYTDLFFESVPDSFIDVKSDEWKWQEGNNTIPLIIPNQFLDLYNFGFAPSQNLVQLTQPMVMALPITLIIQHGSAITKFNGRVVGFSDRISSVLVPQNFLTWANRQYGNNLTTGTSRVVIKTTDPGNPDLVAYLNENNLVTDADKTRFSKYRKIVNTIVSASWITGATMLLFAILVFSLFIQLTIAATKSEINLLITLGVAPRQLHKFLIKQFFPANFVIVVFCLLVIALLQWILSKWLQQQNMYVEANISAYTIITASLLILILLSVHYFTIKKYINKA